MLQLDQLSIAYQGKRVVHQVSFSLESGEIGCLLGPSGCGKTSILRAIGGFEQIEQGKVVVQELLVSASHTNLSPERRSIGMVFQDFALFPHLSVGQNISFGLHSWSANKRTKRLAELLELVGLCDDEHAYPHQLSGGQQQRVALARALAPKPSLLLLDEPFSSLDAELREDLAKEIRSILKHEGTTALMVTHDQHEAFSMADKIGVLNQGRLLQWASAYQLYHKPATRFVADFVGNGVFLHGEFVQGNVLQTSLGKFTVSASSALACGKIVDLLVRPDDIVHDDASPSTAKVIGRAFKGAHILYELQLNHVAKEKVLCLAPSHHDHKIGEQIGIRMDLEHLIFFS